MLAHKHKTIKKRVHHRRQKGMGMESQFNSERAEEKTKNKVLTARQEQYIEAYRATGSAAKAAKLLGVSADAVSEGLHRVCGKLGVTAIRELLDESFSKPNKEVATGAELMRLLKQQDYRCALTGEKLTPNTAELDHKTPKSKGGEDTLDNLQWLDRTVNRMKGRLTTEEFIAICKRVVQWAS
jgi:hypothetical protein